MLELIMLAFNFLILFYRDNPCWGLSSTPVKPASLFFISGDFNKNFVLFHPATNKKCPPRLSGGILLAEEEGVILHP